MPNVKVIGYEGRVLWQFLYVCEKTKKKKEKTKKLCQFLKSHISGTLEEILLKFGMWGTDVGRHVRNKNRPVA